MDNSSILKVVRRIESFEYFSICAHNGTLTNHRVSFPPEIVDFIPEAEKYFKIKCLKCGVQVLFSSMNGNSINEGIGHCLYKRLSWTHKLCKDDLRIFSNTFKLKMLKIEGDDFSLRCIIDEETEKLAELFYKNCSECGAEYFLIFSEVGRHKNWEHIGDIYVHGIWQVELSPEFREKHFKPQAKPS